MNTINIRYEDSNHKLIRLERDVYPGQFNSGDVFVIDESYYKVIGCSLSEDKGIQVVQLEEVEKNSI